MGVAHYDNDRFVVIYHMDWKLKEKKDTHTHTHKHSMVMSWNYYGLFKKGEWYKKKNQ